MAKIKISQLTAKAANLDNTDLLPIAEDAGGGLYVTKSVSGKDVIDAAVTGGGGGASVNYYLNGSVSASVATYNQLSKNAIIGTGTDFNLTGNGLIAQFLTDAGDPNRLLIPSGAWNFEMFFNISSSGGNTKFYVELLKYDGSIFTSIASGSVYPEEITGGTNVDLYITSLAVPTTSLLVTDRLAVRVYIVDNSGGRTVTLHTEDNTLCEIITTFSSGVTSLNGLTENTQYLETGTSGTDFAISSVTDTHTFNLPTASATNRGALSSTDWIAFNGIIFTIELIDLLTVNFYAPYNLKINTITNVLNAPTTTILDDGVAYTLTNTILMGSLITVTVNTASVVNLNIVKA